MTTSALVTDTLKHLASHTPWFADKVGGAMVSIPVKGLWETIKNKLIATEAGRDALDELTLSDACSGEALREQLLEAVNTDSKFAGDLELLLRETYSQSAVGSANKQILIGNSSDVNINLS